MTFASHDNLIHGLAADLKPVGRLRRPAARAVVWLAAVAVIAAGLSAFADLGAMWQRITAAPDLWLAVIGSAATGNLGGIAAVALRVADGSGGLGGLPPPA